MKAVKTIIWDWNGTLLDDLNICIKSINKVLDRRGLQTISKTYYKSIFTFPVKEYYKQLGFDFSKEYFEVPANEFIELYYSNFSEASLHKNVNNILDQIQSCNIDQFLLSAMEQSALQKTVSKFGIQYYFKSLHGIQDSYASGKIEEGNQLIEKWNINPETTYMIGDTVHDHEVAERMGVNCLLIAHGHQTYERLVKTNVPVFHNVLELKEYITCN